MIIMHVPLILVLHLMDVNTTTEIVIMETNVFRIVVILLKDVNMKIYQLMTKMLVPMTAVPQM